MVSIVWLELSYVCLFNVLAFDPVFDEISSSIESATDESVLNHSVTLDTLGFCTNLLNDST